MLKTDKKTFQKGLLLTFSIVLVILIADQWIKFYVKSNFGTGEVVPLAGDWFLMEYIENPGMAFGTTFGSTIWSKLALSIFRIIAISGITYYWFYQSKKGVRWDFHIGVALVLAGATGNLIDCMFYDYWFPYDPCFPYNIAEGSGNFVDCPIFGETETKFRGFLLGNVVDMFKFQGYWPQWMPFLAGKEIFPAIWNLADGSITVGVVLVFVRQKTFFPNQEKKAVPADEELNPQAAESEEPTI